MFSALAMTTSGLSCKSCRYCETARRPGRPTRSPKNRTSMVCLGSGFSAAALSPCELVDTLSPSLTDRSYGHCIRSGRRSLLGQAGFLGGCRNKAPGKTLARGLGLDAGQGEWRPDPQAWVLCRACQKNRSALTKGRYASSFSKASSSAGEGWAAAWGRWLAAARMAAIFSRTLVSSSLSRSGLSFKKSRAFSRPWPSFSSL